MKPQHSSQQPGTNPAMLQLWSRQNEADDDSSSDRPDTVLPDQSMSFWIPRDKPGVYEICWNSELVPTNEPRAFSESLGLLEIQPSLSVVGMFTSRESPIHAQVYGSSSFAAALHARSYVLVSGPLAPQFCRVAGLSAC